MVSSANWSVLYATRVNWRKSFIPMLTYSDHPAILFDRIACNYARHSCVVESHTHQCRKIINTPAVLSYPSAELSSIDHNTLFLFASLWINLNYGKITTFVPSCILLMSRSVGKDTSTILFSSVRLEFDFSKFCWISLHQICATSSL